MAKKSQPQTPMRGFNGFPLAFRLGYESMWQNAKSWPLQKLEAHVSAKKSVPDELAFRGEAKALSDLLILRRFEDLTASHQEVRCDLARRSRVNDDETRVIKWACSRRKVEN